MALSLHLLLTPIVVSHLASGIRVQQRQSHAPNNDGNQRSGSDADANGDGNGNANHNASDSISEAAARPAIVLPAVIPR